MRPKRSRFIAVRSRRILPLSNRQVSEKVRQPNRKRAKPGILLRERQDVGESPRWRFSVFRGRRLFKQRRQNVEKFVIWMPQRYDVVGAGAILFFARRVSDAHGNSPNSGRTRNPIVMPSASIESRANLSPKWDQLSPMTAAPSGIAGRRAVVWCQPKARVATIPRPAMVTANRKP